MVDSLNKTTTNKHNNSFLVSVKESLISLQNKRGGQIGTADYHSDSLIKLFNNGGYAVPIIEEFMNAEDCLKNGAAKVDESKNIYLDSLKKLRGEIKNDVAVISASSAKSISEIEKLATSAQEFINKMTSAEMEKSILNAERMATALQAISQLSDNKITFAIMGNSKLTNRKLC